MNVPATVITIGTSNPVEFDTAKLPEASVIALIRRGASHVFGNEVASKIVGWRNKHQKDWLAVEGQTVENYTPPTDDEESAQREIFKGEALRALQDGTLGQRERSAGITVDPLDAEMAKIAKEQIKLILAGQQGPDGQKLKLPKAGESVTFSNGATRTLEEMIAKRFELKGEEIKKQANDALKAKAKRAKAAEAAVAGEELGL